MTEKCKPQVGIEVEMIVTARDGSDITEKQMLDFLYGFVDLAIKFGWETGGGMTLVDVNECDEAEDNHQSGYRAHERRCGEYLRDLPPGDEGQPGEGTYHEE